MGAFDVKQTSLAVSNLSQIGDVIEVAEVGDVWTKPNGEVWLRSGVAASPALYPSLLNFPGYLANGLPSLLPANNAVSNMAANGAGVAILAMGTYDSTNVYSRTRLLPEATDRDLKSLMMEAEHAATVARAGQEKFRKIQEEEEPPEAEEE